MHCSPPGCEQRLVRQRFSSELWTGKLSNSSLPSRSTRTHRTAQERILRRGGCLSGPEVGASRRLL
ncbi:hypothetical protein L227DRAFT_581859 [Lentinus tigrinus ALCF2SS1-6]|uniref:Uncharacterized protein n=1 Tax=Lentinus tigrinus ALCF2SS1-6 TaxID=1328759 RepID=A0A5C2RMZ2_9APHY|nr:hypothetical protein L227DRAFT_581859 [Lentinus tigrinus ALCF2SS1-6]